MGALSYSMFLAAIGLAVIAYELRQIRLILSKNNHQPNAGAAPSQAD